MQFPLSQNAFSTMILSVDKFVMIISELIEPLYKYIHIFWSGMEHGGIAYILVLKIYLNVQALFVLLLSLHHFVINVLQMNVLIHVV